METYTHPGAPGIEARNPFTVEGDVVRMELTQGQTALLDLNDLPVVAVHRWCADKGRSTHYASTRIPSASTKGKQKKITMHRLLQTTSPENPCVDHTNHDGLDNRSANIRAASAQENCHNRGPHEGSTSEYKGVSFHKQRRQWRASIKLRGQHKHLGAFRCPTLAALAYDRAARELHGEFAALNFPSAS